MADVREVAQCPVEPAKCARLVEAEQRIAGEWLRDYQAHTMQMAQLSEELRETRSEVQRATRDIRALFGRLDAAEDRQDTTMAETVRAKVRAAEAQAIATAALDHLAAARAAGALAGKQAATEVERTKHRTTRIVAYCALAASAIGLATAIVQHQTARSRPSLAADATARP